MGDFESPSHARLSVADPVTVHGAARTPSEHGASSRSSRSRGDAELPGFDSFGRSNARVVPDQSSRSHPDSGSLLAGYNEARTESVRGLAEDTDSVSVPPSAPHLALCGLTALVQVGLTESERKHEHVAATPAMPSNLSCAVRLPDQRLPLPGAGPAHSTEVPPLVSGRSVERPRRSLIDPGGRDPPGASAQDRNWRTILPPLWPVSKS